MFLPPPKSSLSPWQPFLQRTARHFRQEHKRLCTFFQDLEERLSAPLSQKLGQSLRYQSWRRTGGFGVMAFLDEGRLFEKGAVLFSKMQGQLSARMRSILPGGKKGDGFFQATGVSLIFHPRHPDIPSAHMNIRLLHLGEEAFFGGVCDLTPTRDHARCQTHPDALFFHKILQEYHTDGPVSYQDACEQCAAYFFLPHRRHERGIGGSFFEHLKADEEALSFVCRLPHALMKAYGTIVERHVSDPITQAGTREQLFWRGRYVEFVLLYDKGTRFGLETGGQVDAIFSSLPPRASWRLFPDGRNA